MEFARKGDRKRARDLIAKAVKSDPSLKQGWWALSHLLDEQDQQLDCIKQVLKLDPSNEQALAKLEELQGASQSGIHQPQDPPASLNQEPPSPRVSRGRNRYATIAVAVVGVILVGALLTWLVAGGALQGLFGGEQDELADLPVPAQPVAWTPTNDITVLVPTFTLMATASPPVPQASPTITGTLAPSLTPTLRYTPTITPTFNPRLQTTMTRSPPETCPAAASPGPLQLTNLFDDFYAAADEILAYLNEGGSIAEVQRALGEMEAKTELIVADLTRDGVDEIVFFTLPVYVFGCQEGVYVELLSVQPNISDPYFSGLDLISQDLNSNGVADLVIESSYMGVRNSTLNVEVYEWDGDEFVSLIPEAVHHPYHALGHIMFDPGVQVSMFNGHMELEDIDRNGTIEIILRGGVEYGYIGQLSAPQAVEFHTWMWNGEEFNFYDVAFSQPTLKIHAVQAADVASQLSDYAEALDLYWQAIKDPALEAWNVERNEWMPEWTDPGTPTPTHPPPDPDQGDRVEAYARFRIVVTNLLLGHSEEAEAQYQNLLDLHPAGNPGHPYAQMATRFYDAYQGSNSIGMGCAAARTFAEENSGEILGSLGWAVYGEANRDYDAEDICPFR
jgi:tetratricopeptide (TPR) repeat protein